MKFLIDSDLLLEMALKRSKFFEEARLLFNLPSKNFNFYITSIGLDKIRFWLNHFTGNSQKIRFSTIQECKVNQKILESARKYQLIDFESAVEVACAEEYNFDAIITQHQANFVDSPIPIFSVIELARKKITRAWFSSEESIKRDSSFSEKVLSRELRTQIVEFIASNFTSIQRDTIRRLIKKFPQLVEPSGNLYHNRRTAACLRDLEILMRYILYAFWTENATILDDRCLNGLRETYICLGVPCDAAVTAIQNMKEACLLMINHRFYHIIKEEKEEYKQLISELTSYFVRVINELMPETQLRQS